MVPSATRGSEDGEWAGSEGSRSWNGRSPNPIGTPSGPHAPREKLGEGTAGRAEQSFGV